MLDGWKTSTEGAVVRDMTHLDVALIYIKLRL